VLSNYTTYKKYTNIVPSLTNDPCDIDDLERTVISIWKILSEKLKPSGKKFEAIRPVRRKIKLKFFPRPI